MVCGVSSKQSCQLLVRYNLEYTHCIYKNFVFIFAVISWINIKKHSPLLISTWKNLYVSHNTVTQYNYVAFITQF